MRICSCGKPNTLKNSPICMSCIHKQRWVRERSRLYFFITERCAAVIDNLNHLIDVNGVPGEGIRESLEILELQVTNLIDRIQDDILLGKRKNVA